MEEKGRNLDTVIGDYARISIGLHSPTPPFSASKLRFVGERA